MVISQDSCCSQGLVTVNAGSSGGCGCGCNGGNGGNNGPSTGPGGFPPGYDNQPVYPPPPPKGPPGSGPGGAPRSGDKYKVLSQCVPVLQLGPNDKNGAEYIDYDLKSRITAAIQGLQGQDKVDDPSSVYAVDLRVEGHSYNGVATGIGSIPITATTKKLEISPAYTTGTNEPIKLHYTTVKRTVNAVAAIFELQVDVYQDTPQVRIKGETKNTVELSGQVGGISLLADIISNLPFTSPSPTELKPAWLDIKLCALAYNDPVAQCLKNMPEFEDSNAEMLSCWKVNGSPLTSAVVHNSGVAPHGITLSRKVKFTSTQPGSLYMSLNAAERTQKLGDILGYAVVDPSLAESTDTTNPYFIYSGAGIGDVGNISEDDYIYRILTKNNAATIDTTKEYEIRLSYNLNPNCELEVKRFKVSATDFAPGNF